MEAFQLYKESGDATGVFACGKCGRVGWNRDAAERCCVPSKCVTCGKEEKMRECRECFNAKEVAKEAARFDAAEKITEWNGWVYSDGLGYKNGFFESTEDLLDYIEDEPDFSQREYVWPCQPSPFVLVSADDIYEGIENDERAYENFDRNDLKGTEELEAAIAAFEKANEDIVSYSPDYSKVIVLNAQPTTTPEAGASE